MSTDTLIPQAEIGEPSCQRPFERGKVKSKNKGFFTKRYRHCGRLGHVERKCWWKMKKCLRCGDSEHWVKNYLEKERNVEQSVMAKCSQQNVKEFPLERSNVAEVMPAIGQGTSQIFCGFCGLHNHTDNECWRKTGKCLWCGRFEHQVKDCPWNRPENAKTHPQCFSI